MNKQRTISYDVKQLETLILFTFKDRKSFYLSQFQKTRSLEDKEKLNIYTRAIENYTKQLQNN